MVLVILVKIFENLLIAEKAAKISIENENKKTYVGYR
jgi:hypothetical protein